MSKLSDCYFAVNQPDNMQPCSCGEQPTLFGNGYPLQKYFVGCDACQATGATNRRPEVAVAAWNNAILNRKTHVIAAAASLYMSPYLEDACKYDYETSVQRLRRAGRYYHWLLKVKHIFDAEQTQQAFRLYAIFYAIRDSFYAMPEDIRREFCPELDQKE